VAVLSVTTRFYASEGLSATLIPTSIDAVSEKWRRMALLIRGSENPRVGGSIPSHATIRALPEWSAWEDLGRAPALPARLSPLDSRGRHCLVKALVLAFGSSSASLGNASAVEPSAAQGRHPAARRGLGAWAVERKGARFSPSPKAILAPRDRPNCRDLTHSHHHSLLAPRLLAARGESPSAPKADLFRRAPRCQTLKYSRYSCGLTP